MIFFLFSALNLKDDSDSDNDEESNWNQEDPPPPVAVKKESESNIKASKNGHDEEQNSEEESNWDSDIVPSNDQNNIPKPLATNPLKAKIDISDDSEDDGSDDESNWDSDIPLPPKSKQTKSSNVSDSRDREKATTKNQNNVTSNNKESENKSLINKNEDDNDEEESNWDSDILTSQDNNNNNNKKSPVAKTDAVDTKKSNIDAGLPSGILSVMTRVLTCRLVGCLAELTCDNFSNINIRNINLIVILPFQPQLDSLEGFKYSND